MKGHWQSISRAGVGGGGWVWGITSGWVTLSRGDSAVVSGRVRLGVKWGCGQWPGWAWDQQDPVSSLGLISSFLFGEWGKGIYNWTKKLRRLKARGWHIAGPGSTWQLCWAGGGVFSRRPGGMQVGEWGKVLGSALR